MEKNGYLSNLMTEQVRETQEVSGPAEECPVHTLLTLCDGLHIPGH